MYGDGTSQEFGVGRLVGWAEAGLLDLGSQTAVFQNFSRFLLYHRRHESHKLFEALVTFSYSLCFLYGVDYVFIVDYVFLFILLSRETDLLCKASQRSCSLALRSRRESLLSPFSDS